MSVFASCSLIAPLERLSRLCSDADFMRNVWQQYDAQHGDTGAKVFTMLIAALKRLVTGKPSVLGISQQMFGVGVQAIEASNSAAGVYGLDGVAGMVATAASATMSMMGSEAGLSIQGSAMKVQW